VAHVSGSKKLYDVILPRTVTILEMSHVHLLVNVKPTDSASFVMQRVKGRASSYLRKEFPELLKLPTLWTPSYFVGSVGNVSTETVRKYIEGQRNK
ncbi:IS200/IS605 family transposase, partial [Microcoleus sp. S36b_A4]|uniref:IS200/IS605 family transposase n=1 Tax=Microcoleus sp. S36b_A4 TaxID=3055420 RepID=UPI002FCFD0FE